MGRAEDRKKKKSVNRRITDKQFQALNSDINQEFIKQEVKEQVGFFQELFTECLTEAFKNNGISNTKAGVILDDIRIIMIRKVEEKRSGKVG